MQIFKGNGTKGNTPTAEIIAQPSDCIAAASDLMGAARRAEKVNRMIHNALNQVMKASLETQDAALRDDLTEIFNALYNANASVRGEES